VSNTDGVNWSTGNDFRLTSQQMHVLGLRLLCVFYITLLIKKKKKLVNKCKSGTQFLHLSLLLTWQKEKEKLYTLSRSYLSRSHWNISANLGDSQCQLLSSWPSIRIGYSNIVAATNQFELYMECSLQQSPLFPLSHLKNPP
jgi:hypothetical protein